MFADWSCTVLVHNRTCCEKYRLFQLIIDLCNSLISALSRDLDLKLQNLVPWLRRSKFSFYSGTQISRQRDIRQKYYWSRSTPKLLRLHNIPLFILHQQSFQYMHISLIQKTLMICIKLSQTLDPILNIFVFVCLFACDYHRNG